MFTKRPRLEQKGNAYYLEYRMKEFVHLFKSLVAWSFVGLYKIRYPGLKR